MERRRSRLALLGVAPALFVLLFFAWPVAAIVARGLSGGGLSDVLRDTTLRRVAWFTVWQAGLSTACAVALGLPLAFVLARYRFRGRALVESLLIVPFVLPTVVVGAAFLALLHGEQSVRGVLLAHVFFNVPVVVRTVTPLWRKLDPRFADAARTLGAGRVQVWRNVTLPLLRQSVLAAAGIVFLFTFTSFGVVLLLGGPRRRTLEVGSTSAPRNSSTCAAQPPWRWCNSSCSVVYCCCRRGVRLVPRFVNVWRITVNRPGQWCWYLCSSPRSHCSAYRSLRWRGGRADGPLRWAPSDGPRSSCRCAPR